MGWRVGVWMVKKLERGFVNGRWAGLANRDMIDLCSILLANGFHWAMAYTIGQRYIPFTN